MRKFDLAALFPTVEPAWQKTVAWWNARNVREQWLIGVTLALLIVWLLVTAIILPIQRTRAAALADIRTYESLSARIRGAGGLGDRPAQPQAGESPTAILSATAAPYGIVPVINSEAAGLRVTVADAPYDGLIRWIAAVEQSSPLRVVKMRLTRGPASGLVSADLTVAA